MSDSIGGLPSGWVLAPLGDLAETALGKMLDKKKQGDASTRPYLRNVNVQWGRIDFADVLEMAIPEDEIERFSVRKGDLLVCEGGEIGRAAIWMRDDEIAYQKALHRVRPSTALSLSYLRYYLEYAATTGALAKLATGSTIKHLPQQRLREVTVPVPPPAEQHRIVEILEEQLSRLDAASTSLVSAERRILALRARVTDYTASVTLAEESAAAAPPEPAGTIDGELPRIPADWFWHRLGEIAEVVGGVTKDKKRQSDPEVPEVPYLRVANVQRGHLNLDVVTRIRVPADKASRLRLKKGDVLLNEGGDRNKLGRGWIWEEQVAGAIHQNHVFRARVQNGIIKPELLSHYANGMGRWFEENGKQSVNLASISLKKIKCLPVPVPPQEEQEEILRAIRERIALLDRAQQGVETAQKRAKALRNALLRKAFTGALVPQDPADEPASVALERVAAERAAAAAASAKKTRQPRKRATPTPKPPAAEATAPEPTRAPVTSTQPELFQ
ncbi:restriction endonuclease subunit S [Streptomyces sp. NPDC051684]|uniref:restriction endonuclease subunit S n=1 Tax=Streptomyces sp. NPDC051684 TaxID=3365670 RepID=UPI0037B4BED7